VQYILTTPSCVFLMPCVFLALPGKENSRPVQHVFTSTYVFLLPFFSLHCLLKKQHIYATHSYNHDVFEFCMCSLPCLVKEQQPCATHSYNNLWCVLMPCVFLAQKQKTCANTFLQHPPVCFYAVYVPCTAW
jgi:hypothetical protein